MRLLQNSGGSARFLSSDTRREYLHTRRRFKQFGRRNVDFKRSGCVFASAEEKQHRNPRARRRYDIGDVGTKRMADRVPHLLTRESAPG